MPTTEVQSIPVKIHLTTTIFFQEEPEKYELTLFGSHYRKKDAVFLKYDEVQEEGTIHTIVKLSGEEALILRKGAVTMRLPFRLKEKMNGSYDSPYGTLALSTKTKKLSHTYTDEGTIEGEVQLTYSMIMQGTTVGTYDMRIEYKEDIREQ